MVSTIFAASVSMMTTFEAALAKSLERVASHTMSSMPIVILFVVIDGSAANTRAEQKTRQAAHRHCLGKIRKPFCIAMIRALFYGDGDAILTDKRINAD